MADNSSSPVVLTTKDDKLNFIAEYLISHRADPTHRANNCDVCIPSHLSSWLAEADHGCNVGGMCDECFDIQYSECMILYECRECMDMIRLCETCDSKEVLQKFNHTIQECDRCETPGNKHYEWDGMSYPCIFDMRYTLCQKCGPKLPLSFVCDTATYANKSCIDESNCICYKSDCEGTCGGTIRNPFYSE
jgi:hypothetical protein